MNNEMNNDLIREINLLYSQSSFSYFDYAKSTN